MPLEVAAGREPAGEVDDDLAVGRRAVDVRTAGERQPEHARDLVEGLARGVVDRGAQRPDVARHVGHEQQGRVPAAHEQRHGRLGQTAVLQLVDRHVSGEVVDAVDRYAERERERLRGGHAHEQCAGETRACGDGDRVDVGEPHAGGLARALQSRDHRVEVGAARDLGHHAAEARVLVDAACERVADEGRATHQAHAGLVARRLDAEHQGLVGHDATPSWARRRRSTTAWRPGP